jgi:hypothetical protein
MKNATSIRDCHAKSLPGPLFRLWREMRKGAASRPGAVGRARHPGARVLALARWMSRVPLPADPGADSEGHLYIAPPNAFLGHGVATKARSSPFIMHGSMGEAD